jgi:hypothetical protein
MPKMPEPHRPSFCDDPDEVLRRPAVDGETQKQWSGVVRRLDVHIADGELAFARVTPKGGVNNPTVKRRNYQDDCPARYRADGGTGRHSASECAKCPGVPSGMSFGVLIFRSHAISTIRNIQT